MAPEQIFIIRHAEKPAESKDPNLSTKGRERAEALSHFPFPPLAEIFAAADTAESVRPVQTVTPLSRVLDLAVKSEIKDAEYSKLAELVLDGQHDGEILLICWHHGHIPKLARALGATAVAPVPWPVDVFDRIWVLTYGAQGGPTFENRPQRLLPGDSTAVIRV